MSIDTVRALKAALDDYGDDVEPVFVADDGTQFRISAVEPVTVTRDGGAGVGLYID